MTYHALAPALRRYGTKAAFAAGARHLARKPRHALGDDATDCVDEANSKTAPLDATILDMAKNWNPSGFYSPDQMQALIAQAQVIEKAARAHLTSASAVATQDARSGTIADAFDKLDASGSRSLDFIQAMNTAKTQGIKIVDAPGLRKWVLDTMSAASNAHVVAYTMECITPSVVTAIIAYQEAFDKAASVVKKVVGVVVSAGDAILHLPDTVADIYPYVKWGLLVGAGIWVFMELRKRAA